jgi:hypothetical protein
MSLRVRTLSLDVVILAVAAHSMALGLALLCFPMWVLKLVGWDYSGEAFWPSQAGLFLILLGTAYAAALCWRPLAWLLIGSKGCAIVFLWAHVLWLGAPRLAGLLGIGDGLMGLVTAVLLISVGRAERREPPPGS